MNPHGGAIAVAIVQLLASLLSSILIDTVGRIPLLIASSVFMTLALTCFGSYAYYESINKPAAFDLSGSAGLGNNDWIPLLCVLVFTVAFSLGKSSIIDMNLRFNPFILFNISIYFVGISPISSLLVGELFPLEYRGMGSSIATSFSYFCAFLGVKTFVDFQVIKKKSEH